ncbi:MAG TPA: hypothetical protein PKE00_15075, partial [Planctomycetota bacterium]|nr:hypothetical protein [Planctomycetota bacterium]
PRHPRTPLSGAPFMTASIPSADDLLLQRALDAELRPSEWQAFEQRLEADADFRRRFEELELLRDLRGAARPESRLTTNFADRVVARALALQTPVPTEASTARATVSATEVKSSTAVELKSPLSLWLERAIVVAALVLVGLGVLLFARPTVEPTTMEASPELRSELRRLYDELAERERLDRLDRARNAEAASETDATTRGR